MVNKKVKEDYISRSHLTNISEVQDKIRNMVFDNFYKLNKN